MSGDTRPTCRWDGDEDTIDQCTCPPLWRPGDRVELFPGGPKRGRVTGTVREIVHRPRPGVIVDFDYPVRGTTWCMATHIELTRIGSPL